MTDTARGGQVRSVAKAMAYINEKLGIQEGDTVRMYGFSFEYYRNADTVPGNFEEDEEE